MRSAEQMRAFMTTGCWPPRFIINYSVIQKDGFNFVCRLGEEPVSVVGGMAWTVNGASTHARQLVAVFQVLCWLYGLTWWATFRTLLNSSHVLLWYTRSAGAFTFKQTAHLLKLVIPTTNALPRWRLNVETKTKRKLYSSHRLSFNELTNAKKSCAA